MEIKKKKEAEAIPATLGRTSPHAYKKKFNPMCLV